jgi:hypothetical protein
MSPYEIAFQKFQVAFFFRAVAENGGNFCAAARAMGVHRNTVTRALHGAGYSARRVRRIIAQQKALSKQATVPGRPDPQQVLSAGQQLNVDGSPAPAPLAVLNLRDIRLSRANVAQQLQQSVVAAHGDEGADRRARVLQEAVDIPAPALHEVKKNPHRESVPARAEERTA